MLARLRFPRLVLPLVQEAKVIVLPDKVDVALVALVGIAVLVDVLLVVLAEIVALAALVAKVEIEALAAPVEETAVVDVVLVLRMHSPVRKKVLSGKKKFYKFAALPKLLRAVRK